MPGPHTRSGLTHYVEGRNPGPHETRQVNPSGGNVNLDEFKMPVPNTKVSSNRGQARNSGQPRNHGHKDSREPQPRRDAGSQEPFWDTDLSSIGASSTTPSAKHDRGAPATSQAEPANGHAEADEGSASAEESGEDELHDDEYEHTNTQVNGLHLTQNQRYLMELQDRRFKQPSNVSSFPYMKGDSYPQTTSGNPSVTNSNDHARQSLPHSKMADMVPSATQQVRQPTSMRAQLGTPRVQEQLQSRDTPTVQHRGVTNHQSILERPNVQVVAAVEQQISEGFQYGKAHKPPTTTHPPVGRDQRPIQVKSSKPPASMNTADRGSIPATQKSQPSDAIPQQRQQHNERDLPQRQKDLPTPTMEQPIVNSDTGYEQLSDVDLRIHNGLPAEAGTQQQQHEPEDLHLDYQSSELFQMSYRDLKAQSFDLDPNAEHSKLTGLQGNLHEKLGMFARENSDDQSKFFASLTIDEWEQAGDWFITQLSEVLGRLKNSRRAKREAARSFEDEIEIRHEAVSKKRKLTENELKDMKTSGVKVLQGTPKKTKTK